MDGFPKDDSDSLHQLITRSLVHRRALWTLLLSTYRAELTHVLDHAAKLGFAAEDRHFVAEVAGHVMAVASEIDLPNIRSDALTLRNYATNEPETETGERRVLLAGLNLIERILDTERARQNAEGPRESAQTN